MAPVIITGVPPQDNSVRTDPPARLEIRDFIKNEKFFSLYVQALKAMYKDDPVKEPTSYFQIAGIHGLPYKSWNDVTPEKTYNYCEHSTVLFPTWHRAYLVLFEQRVQQHAAKIAKGYTGIDKDLWAQAAADIRQPFWDWARPGGRVPPKQIISDPRVDITLPSGKDSVENPFLAFTFPNGTFSGKTLRAPIAGSNSIEKRLEQRATTLSGVMDSLLTLKTWGEFSNKGATVGGKTYSSLEAAHDSVHVALGGHMSQQAFAAFDPIFWLHHCQIDRLLSLWSAVNPGVWVSQGRDKNESSELIPFWNSLRTKWPSSGLKDTTVFNYTYPEFKDVNTNGLSAPEYFGELIKRLYPGSGSVPSVPREIKPLGRLAAAKANFVMAETAQADAVFETPEEPATIWSARIRCNDFGVDSSFSVFIFMGKEGDIPDDSNLVGCNDVFVNTKPENCANCMENADLKVEGYVQLNDALENSVRSVKEDIVKPYLRENLQWRVVRTDGTTMPLESLEITVIATPILATGNETFPVLGEPRELHECTEGRY